MNEPDWKDKIRELEDLAQLSGLDLSQEINLLRKKLDPDLTDAQSLIANQTWEIVQSSRRQDRPKPQHFIENLISGFMEFHGDRTGPDDRAIIGGIGNFDGQPVTAIGTRKGHDLSSNMEYNFGMPLPQGYRKALRLARQAEKFRRPILFFVDTPGAYCGIEAEERGISRVIANNLFELSEIRTPMITVITGEGGSGGALALSVSDRILMMENSIFSVISPEGCASILFRDASKAAEAAESLKLSSRQILDLGIADAVIPEGPGMHENPTTGYANLRESLIGELQTLNNLSTEELVEQRYQKFRTIGSYHQS